MYNKYIVLLALLHMVTNLLGAIKFSNVKCVAFDPPFASFEKCDLKLVKRGVVSLNIHAKLHHRPVSNISISIALFKKASGYRPFLYNVTTNFCLFMKNTKKIPQFKIVMDAVSKKSNINHSCPYDHDLIVDKLVLQENMFKLIPLPPGDYMIKLIVGAYNDWKADVRIYINFNTDAV